MTGSLQLQTYALCAMRRWTTHEGVEALLEGGDIDDQKKAKFISAVKLFWTTVHRYATDRLPYGDEVVLNSQWIDYF